MTCTDEEMTEMRAELRRHRIARVRTQFAAEVFSAGVWAGIAVAALAHDWPTWVKVCAVALAMLKSLDVRLAWRMWKAARR